jgi:hypothetical protein
MRRLARFAAPSSDPEQRFDVLLDLFVDGLAQRGAAR